MFSSACYTFFCDSSSKAEVASSSIKIAGAHIIALAIAILYFCPPDSFPPFVPHEAL